MELQGRRSAKVGFLSLFIVLLFLSDSCFCYWISLLLGGWGYIFTWDAKLFLGALPVNRVGCARQFFTKNVAYFLR
jgi:hypothetical protein